jgi:hypothetical protein
MKVLLMATTQAKHDMDRLTMWPSPVGLTSMTAHGNVVRRPLQILDMLCSAHAYPGRRRVYTATACSVRAVAV